MMDAIDDFIGVMEDESDTELQASEASDGGEVSDGGEAGEASEANEENEVSDEGEASETSEAYDSEESEESESESESESGESVKSEEEEAETDRLKALLPRRGQSPASDAKDQSLSINGQAFVLSLQATTAPNGLGLIIQTRIGHPAAFLPAQDGDAAFSVLFKGKAYEVKAPASGTLKQLRHNTALVSVLFPSHSQTLVRRGCRVLPLYVSLRVNGKKRPPTAKLASLPAEAVLEAIYSCTPLVPTDGSLREKLDRARHTGTGQLQRLQLCVARELELLVPAAVRYDWLGVLQASCYPFLVSLTLHSRRRGKNAS